MQPKLYDCIIIGGGLAGLSLSILLAQKKYQVLLLEKKAYPYHKVCGEYISMESWDFIERLGIPLSELQLPKITQLVMTAVSGKSIHQLLDLGGFGISRYSLDYMLAQKAKELGVMLLENTSCTNYAKLADETFQINTKQSTYFGRVVCASFGRHSFGNFYKANPVQQNWIGVKYHIKGNFLNNTIALHTFKSGYCGISKIDHETFCLCYLAKASILKLHNNQIDEMEKQVLWKNTHLKKIFQTAEFVFQKPITISNVTFHIKKPVLDGVFYLGDASGSIAPLTGNGMSNAMRASFILHTHLDDFFQKSIDFKQLMHQYEMAWKREFKARINLGRWVQYFFCMPLLTPLFIFVMSLSKSIRLLIIKRTHGDVF
jgi:menaquinone-9 beta-reductase